MEKDKKENWQNQWYDENNKILYTINYTDGDTHIAKTFYGNRGWWKVYLQQFLQVLGKFNINILNVMCFICENTATGNNIFLGTIETISEYCQISRSTTIRCLNELKEAGFVKMIARGQYMVNPAIMYVGEAQKHGFLIELYEGTRAAPEKVNSHRRYKHKSIQK